MLELPFDYVRNEPSSGEFHLSKMIECPGDITTILIKP